MRLFCSFSSSLRISTPRLPHLLAPFSRQLPLAQPPFRQIPARFLSTMADVEAAKRAAAKAAVANHYPHDARWVGIGSGTTIVYVVEAIKELGIDPTTFKLIPGTASGTPVSFDLADEHTYWGAKIFDQLIPSSAWWILEVIPLIHSYYNRGERRRYIS